MWFGPPPTTWTCPTGRSSKPVLTPYSSLVVDMSSPRGANVAIIHNFFSFNLARDTKFGSPKIFLINKVAGFRDGVVVWDVSFPLPQI